MNLATRLRRALCRHDWLPLTDPTHRVTPGFPNAICRKCGVMRRVEP